jgi:hypothetical protein
MLQSRIAILPMFCDARGRIFQRHSNSHCVMSIGAGLKAGQLAARPNPGSKAKSCAYGKRQKNLRVVFHAVLQ